MRRMMHAGLIACWLLPAAAPFADTAIESELSTALPQQEAGTPRQERSLISSEAARGKGGINTAVLDRAATPEVFANSGPRTDAAIQAVFDRNKSALYAIYQRRLRHDPQVSGRMVLKIWIDPVGAVTQCAAQESTLNDPELERLIVARVKLFDFGPADTDRQETFAYLIDFVPL